MKVSTNFREITEAEAIANPLPDAWQNPSIPAQQLALVKLELEGWLDGKPYPLFSTLLTAIDTIRKQYDPLSILEIGCGVGHNSVVVQRSHRYSPFRLSYTGIDYNPTMIELARKEWGGTDTRFKVANALSLPYPAYAFDIVLHSACLMHLLNWQAALTQAAYVSRSCLILHRTPISRRRTRYFVKSAYGVDCLEIHFSEHDLFAAIDSAGFEYTNSWVTSEDLEHQYKTYLLARKTVFHHPV